MLKISGKLFLNSDEIINQSLQYFQLCNSHAGGMAFARPYGFEIDFVRNPISGSAAWFFVIILEFIFTPILEIKIYEKNFLIAARFSIANFRIPNSLSPRIFVQISLIWDDFYKNFLIL